MKNQALPTAMLKIYGRKKPYSRKSYKYRSKNLNSPEVLKELKIKGIEEGKTGSISTDELNEAVIDVDSEVTSDDNTTVILERSNTTKDLIKEAGESEI